MKKYLFLILTLLFISNLRAQNNILDELNEVSKDEKIFEYPAFKAMKIGNLQSTKVAGKGELYLYVSHRFSSVKDGFETFFWIRQCQYKNSTTL